MYPLLRKSTSTDWRKYSSQISPRLKFAIFAVSSRYATAGSSKTLFSPPQLAKFASRLSRGASLCVDEIKASILLCVHDMSISVGWDSVADIAKLTRMTDLYHALWIERHDFKSAREKGGVHGKEQGRMNSSIDSGEQCVPQDFDVEDWRSVWWCIYKLDTVCSSVA